MSTLAVDGITNGDGSGAPAFPNGVSGNIITTGNLTAANLTLSGGAYLGGTGSANHLDDYEEGTWTPTVNGTATYNSQIGVYTKVGRQVTAHFDFYISSIGTGSTALMSGLPFASGNHGFPQAGIVSYFENSYTNVIFIGCYVQNNLANIYFTAGITAGPTITNAFNLFKNATRIIGSVNYQTA